MQCHLPLHYFEDCSAENAGAYVTLIVISGLRPSRLFFLYSNRHFFKAYAGEKQHTAS